MAAPVNRVKEYFGSVIPKTVPSYQDQASKYFDNDTANQIEEVQRLLYLATLYNVSGQTPPLFYYGISAKEMAFLIALLQKNITPVRDPITYELDWSGKPVVDATTVKAQITKLSKPTTTS